MAVAMAAIVLRPAMTPIGEKQAELRDARLGDSPNKQRTASFVRLERVHCVRRVGRRASPEGERCGLSSPA